MKSLFQALLVGVLCVTVRAETTALLARRDGVWLPVTAMSHTVPLVLNDGALVDASEEDYQLSPIKHYWKGVPAPVVVDVKRVQFRTADIHVGEMGSLEHNVPVISGSVRSPVALNHVFFVIDMNIASGGRTLFVREMGTLVAGRWTSFECAVPQNRFSGRANCFFHVYSNGYELLQSQEGSARIREDIERRIRANIEGVRNAGPSPYFVAPPARPSSMHDHSPVKLVDVTASIAADGSVSSAKAAPGAPSDYAAAAEKAVAGYYFVPKVEHGTPCACRVIVSVQFDPKLDR